MHLNPGSIEDSRLSSESCWLLLCAYVGEGMLVSDGDPCVCRDWVLMQQRIHDHPDFDRWFLEYPEVRRTKNFYDLKFRHTKNKLLYSWPTFHHTVIFLCFLSSSVYFGIFFNKFGCWWCWPSKNLFFQCFFLTDFNENVGCLLVF